VAYKFWDTCSALGVLVLLCDEMDSNALNNFLASFLPRVFFFFFFKFVKDVDWRLSTSGMSQIWLEIIQKSRLSLESCIVLRQ
jgi:hypothetical protein